jgi:type I restriction enzyme S subunit
LGEVCDIQVGSAQVDRATRSGVGPRLFVINARDIVGDRLNTDGPLSPPQEVSSNLARYRVVPGDLVCARTGQLSRAVVVDEDHAGWLIGGTCLRLRVRDGLDSRFLLHYLRHPAVTDWLNRAAVGSVIPTHRLKSLKGLPVAVPPKPDQDAIVATLSVLDEKIAVHNEILRVSAELRERMLRLMLAGEIPDASGV